MAMVATEGRQVGNTPTTPHHAVRQEAAEQRCNVAHPHPRAGDDVGPFVRLLKSFLEVVKKIARDAVKRQPLAKLRRDDEQLRGNNHVLQYPTAPWDRGGRSEVRKRAARHLAH